MAIIKCPECKKDISDKAEHCIHCGYKLTDKDIKDNSEDKTNSKAVYIIISIIIGIILFIGGITIGISYNNMKNQKDNEKKESAKMIRVDISMNEWDGSIEEILDDFGIDFYAVTSGANCYSGMKKNQFETEKYGILYTEFTYCKSDDVQRFRIYNISSDQELRNPKTGEINTYDIYGYRETGKGSSY